jgi:hypothetical protein
MIQSTWLKSLLLFVLVLFTAQCGDESEVIVDLSCPSFGESGGTIDFPCPSLDDFNGGPYSFMVNVGDIDDRCAGGAFNGQIPQGPYGPVTLPSSAALEQGSQKITMELPMVGFVEGTLSLTESFIELTVAYPIPVNDINVPVIGEVDVSACVAGALCPVSENVVEARFAVTVLSINPPLIPTPCTIGVPATGTLQ